MADVLMSKLKHPGSSNGANRRKINENTTENEQEKVRFNLPEKGQQQTTLALRQNDSDRSESGEEESDLADDLSVQRALEKRQRRKTIVNSFRLVELVPTTSTPYSSYRRKSIAFTVQDVVDTKAEEHFQEGIKCSCSNNDYRAISYFNKAISLKPERIKFYVARGEAFLQICDFQSAILNYKKACILDPDNDEYYSRLAFIYFFQGQCLFDQKLYNEALESFSRAAEMKPEVIGYHTRSVACLSALQRHGECLALINKRLEEDTSSPDLYIMRARLHELFRNSALCYYDVKDALLLDPENKEAQTLMASLQKRAKDNKQQAVQFLLVGKVKEALTKISIALETNPAVPEYHIFRGALHRRHADFNAAIDDFLLAMDKAEHDESNPTYKEAQRQLLLCYNDFAVECFSKGFYDEAIVLLNKAIKGEKREKGLYINRGDCFFRASELHFALSDYQQAYEMDPTDHSVLSRLSVVFNEFGILEYYERHYLEAIEYLSTALSYNPRISAYYLSRARARYMIEDSDGARQDLLKCLYLDPHNKEVISIFSRLFPGKSISEVTSGELGVSAAHTVEADIRNTFGHQQLPVVKHKKKDSEGPSNFPGKSVLPPIRNQFFPEIRSCMEEQEFHINIIKNKKKATTSVKKALSARQNLSYKGPRVQATVPVLRQRAAVKTLNWETSTWQPPLTNTS